MLRLQAQWAILIALLPAAAGAQPSLEAERLEAGKGQVVLEGRVRGRVGGCQLRANALRLELTRRVLQGEQVRLCAGHGAELWAHRLRLGPGRALEARLLRGTPCACDDGQGLLGFTARRARVAPEGRRLQLSWPVLRLGPLPVAVLPWLALPLEPGVSGLLPPELGYSGRDGLRLALPLYLAFNRRVDLLLAGGWIQRRGALGRARIRVFHRNLGAELAAVGLRDGSWSRGTLRGRVVARSRSWTVGLAPDLASDPDVVRDLERPVERVFAPYLRSRAWAWAANGPFFVQGTGDLLQHLLRPSPIPDGLQGTARLDLGLAPVRVVGPVLMDLWAGVEHWSGLPDDDGGIRHATWIRCDPGITAAERIGPLRLTARGELRLRVLDVAEQQSESLAAGLLGLQSSLPLVRRFGARILHLVQPLAGVEWSRVGRQLVTPAGVELLDGAVSYLGLESELWRRGPGQPRRLAAVELRAELPLQGDRSVHDALLGGELELRPWRILRGRVAASWAPAAGRLAQLRSELCLALGAELCGGYRRLRLQRAGELVDGAGLAGVIPFDGRRLLLDALEADQVLVGLQGRLGPIALAGQVAWDPLRGELSHATGGASVDLGCGCYRLGLQGQLRADQELPDLLLVLGYQGARELSCF